MVTGSLMPWVVKAMRITRAAATRLRIVVGASSPMRRRMSPTFTRQKTAMTVKLRANPNSCDGTPESARAARLRQASAGGASTFAISRVAAKP